MIHISDMQDITCSKAKKYVLPKLNLDLEKIQHLSTMVRTNTSHILCPYV